MSFEAGSNVKEQSAGAIFDKTGSWSADTFSPGTTQTTGSGKAIQALHIQCEDGDASQPTSWDIQVQCWDPNGTKGTDWSELRNNATGDGNSLFFGDNITFGGSASGTAWILPIKGASTDSVGMGGGPIPIPTNYWRVQVRPVGGGGDSGTSVQVHVVLLDLFSALE